jgi:hypothetical protein
MAGLDPAISLPRPEIPGSSPGLTVFLWPRMTVFFESKSLKNTAHQHRQQDQEQKHQHVGHEVCG